MCSETEKQKISKAKQTVEKILQTAERMLAKKKRKKAPAWAVKLKRKLRENGYVVKDLIDRANYNDRHVYAVMSGRVKSDTAKKHLIETVRKMIEE